jgi:hypothetical protein
MAALGAQELAAGYHRNKRNSSKMESVTIRTPTEIINARAGTCLTNGRAIHHGTKQYSTERLILLRCGAQFPLNCVLRCGPRPED